ncbi:MAG TPA: hypothetical protein VJ912_00240 [Candidatus Nanoarchaeia archaeon]|nr:hypothetical protein [Candidatus Nanoarchaeia archaeon]
MVIRKEFRAKEEDASKVEKIIKKETNNLKKETAIVSTGFNRSNCYKIKKTAEKLGYDVEEPEKKFIDDKGYPYLYTLRKRQ